MQNAIDNIRKSHQVDTQNAEQQREALAKYTIDLTEKARNNQLDPVIGRDDEIRRTIQVLQRRTKNNPVLIGEPGVGKTALVEGRLGGAAVDCPEGATWLEAWVRDVPNLILSPHVGFYSDDAFEEQRARAMADVRLFLETGMRADVGVRLEGGFGFDLGAGWV